jgi:plasmid replication initiation protein
MENNLVVQSNDLVLATYTMSTKEKQLLLSCISQIDSRENAPNITKQTKFTVSMEEMARVFYKDTNRQNIYRDLEQASSHLYERDVLIVLEGNKTLRTRFVSGVLYDPDGEQITMTFAEDILPYLTQLKANFTKYKLIEISELSSIHSIRLYELAVCWIGQYQYSKTMTLDDFRYVMGVEGKYKQFSSLKDRVIETAIGEINASTNYFISVDYHKRGKGKAIKELTLKFHKKILNNLASKDGSLSADTIKAIVSDPQFILDYNDHPSLSYDGGKDTTAFKREMINIINREPESFKKKPLESYLPKIKQGN